ncbi:hypothetical protein Taro_054897 [Colocasia esculenta]|uniref:Uncharacterized protein n=1 Tax=Colocasia esculenta TaxID=4460 RepID=A0A843XRU8_COLES|nr:hypothetical protein [Colocasia esculenta]
MFYKLLVLFTAFVPVVLVCSVLGEFPTEPVTSEAHPYPHRLAVLVGDMGVDANLSVQQKSLEWQIEEIGVVEEMIRRRVPSG